jgi:hypothetical protein
MPTRQQYQPSSSYGLKPVERSPNKSDPNTWTLLQMGKIIKKSWCAVRTSAKNDNIHKLNTVLKVV